MFRSPIFIFLLLFSIYSCDNIPKDKTTLIKEKPKTVNSIEARKLLDKADVFNSNQKFDSAYYFYNRSKIIYELENDSANIAYNLIQMASMQQVLSDYIGSEKNLIEALLYIQQGSPYKSAAYNSLGISSKELYNYEDALYYYNKAKINTTDTIAQIQIVNNKANIHIKQKKYESSIQLLEPLLKSKILETNEVRKAKILDNLGFSYFKNNKYQDGLSMMLEALSIRKKNNDIYALISSNLHLAEYFQKSQPQTANEYALNAYQISKNIHNVDSRLESLSFLIAHNFEKKSNQFAVEYIKLNDSILNVRNNAKNQFIKIKFDSEQNRAENLKLTAQKAENALQLELQKNRTLILSFVLLIGATITVFIVYYLRAKNKREKIQTSYNTEIRIAKKLHDELANDVYQTMAFAETQDLSSFNNKETLLNNLDTIYSRTRNISKENSTIETGINFIPNLKEMMAGFNTEATNIILNGLDTINWSSIENTKKITVYRVLQELLVNMKKHSKSSLVVIFFKINENKICLDYTDNGVGATFDKIKNKNGLQNVENRIQAIKGTVTFDTKSDKGFKATISFPI
ncbi:tetratricopeptide repeat-containing sensor histidine kinase [Flavobacterium sp. K5-23]|uniref:ATP-binding protein n=1 Tax=Flavobacterium sp. K5-23 TaxID=2746225 RepID=UPI00200DE6B2|nr:tetratricopeptide repeat-containing sensor histidine kinase [Flavobacterium sp. K5-23]UQD57554.1 tetratricopeptide repeat protein [Flavobacterium sp. K5-23]